MRFVMGCASVVLAAVLTAAPAAAPAGVPPLRTLDGDWETIIASPKRPWIFLVRFKPDGAGWTGAMRVRGLPDFPLRDILAERGQVRFQLPPELDSMRFDGTWAEGEIVGHVVEAGRTVPMRLTPVVPLPAPANQAEAWRQDLEFAATRLPAYDRSFSPAARERLLRALDQLKSEAPRKSDAEILVALSRAVALGDNAHTRLRLAATSQGSFSTIFPIRIWWFSDGPYVVRTTPEYSRVLRCRVVAVDGHSMSEARSKVEGLFAGNAAWRDYLSPLYLVRADVLHALGLIRSASQASFTFEDSQGSRFTVPVQSEPEDRGSMARESWQELSPLMATGRPPWTSALAAEPAALPLYLRHPDQPYWFEFLPDSGLLYFQFNRSDNAEEGPSLEKFGASLLAFTGQRPVRGVIVDLRLNSGGNLEVAKDFIRGLGENDTINRRGRLFVVIGHCTFSAGLYHAAQLKQFTQAIFVGDTVGDALDYWAEGGEIVLPNSLAVINYSNGFHRYSGKEYPDRQPYYEELSIRGLTPDIPAPTTSKDYFSGRDPALEAIEGAIKPLAAVPHSK